MAYNDELINEVKTNIYCRKCFETNFCKPYKISTATGNLYDHLANVHRIILKKATSDQNQVKINTMLFSKDSENTAVPERDL